MKLNQMKKLGIAAFAAATLMSIALLPAWARSASEDDVAGTYKTSKCIVCHGAKAEKKFDAAIPEADMVKAILGGKKGEKPPNMPAYAEKGINEDQAKALIAYMKSLKQ
jgi:mono/diheme cytochrome c family protein